MFNATILVRWVQFLHLDDTSAGKAASEAKTTWAAAWVILIILAVTSVGAYIVYKYRLRVSCLQHSYVIPFLNGFKLSMLSFFWVLLTDPRIQMVKNLSVPLFLTCIILTKFTQVIHEASLLTWNIFLYSVSVFCMLSAKIQFFTLYLRIKPNLVFLLNPRLKIDTLESFNLY